MYSFHMYPGYARMYPSQPPAGLFQTPEFHVPLEIHHGTAASPAVIQMHSAFQQVPASLQPVQPALMWAQPAPTIPMGPTAMGAMAGYPYASNAHVSPVHTAPESLHGNYPSENHSAYQTAPGSPAGQQNHTHQGNTAIAILRGSSIAPDIHGIVVFRDVPGGGHRLRLKSGGFLTINLHRMERHLSALMDFIFMKRAVVMKATPIHLLSAPEAIGIRIISSMATMQETFPFYFQTTVMLK